MFGKTRRPLPEPRRRRRVPGAGSRKLPPAAGANHKSGRGECREREKGQKGETGRKREERRTKRERRTQQVDYLSRVNVDPANTATNGASLARKHAFAPLSPRDGTKADERTQGEPEVTRRTTTGSSPALYAQRPNLGCAMHKNLSCSACGSTDFVSPSKGRQ